MGLMRWAYTFLAVAAMTIGAVAGDCYDGFPSEDFVDRLPGQPNVTFRQYAGYVEINAKNGKSFFYYFVEAKQNPHQSPLTLWFNGGPGCSSIGGGAFTELGPFYPTGDGRGLVVNSESWNRVSNLLFVEFPVGVGWSYSNTSSDYTTGDDATATDMLTFMFEWYKKFPSFRSRDLFLAGESYAGHYIPQLALRLLNHNAHNISHPFNLKGIVLGNPSLKVDRDVAAMYEYFWSHGLISDEIYLKITKECDFRYYSYAPTLNESQIPCIRALEEAFAIVRTDYADIYGVIYDKCYPTTVEQELRLGKMATKMSYGVDVCKMSETSFYLNLPMVQKALHANRTNLPYDWSDCSDILNYTVKDHDTIMLPSLKVILESNIRIWIYSGDQDSVVPLMGTRAIVRELAQDLNFNISVPYGPWFHQNRVGGWQIEYGDLLTFATVKGGAHMVPYSQPSRALHLFTSFVLGHRLPNTPHVVIY